MTELPPTETVAQIPKNLTVLVGSLPINVMRHRFQSKGETFGVTIA